MQKVRIVTDSNSGITQSEAKALGIDVIPMPFDINGETFFEDITLTQEEFYKKLEEGADISTSQPSIETVTNLWNKLLEEYDAIVHIPMSSGLSGSCQTAMAMAADYDGKVQVVDNQRISVTMKRSVMEALELVRQGKTASEVKKILEDTKFDSSIYITLDTLKYLKKGGRITPAAAALGTLLRIKPVLQIQGEKLDAFAKARTTKQAKNIMTDAVKKDIETRFNIEGKGDMVYLDIAYTNDRVAAEEFKAEVQNLFPDVTAEMYINPLSLSVSCHIGPGALAVTCTKKLTEIFPANSDSTCSK